MAESSERGQDDLNTFREGTNSKVEKDAMNVEETVNDIDSRSISSITYNIDEDIADIQAEAVIAAARSIQTGAISGAIKESNLDIEAALNNTFAKNVEETTESSSSVRSSLTECQLAAYCAIKISEEARVVVASGRDLLETMLSTIEVLQSHIRAFSEKAIEATERATERSYRTADFYNTMTIKYEAAVTTLERRARNVEVALNKVDEAADECLKFAELSGRITDEGLDEARRMKFAACWWTNKGRAAIIVALKKERAALQMMRRMWINVRNDMQSEERSIMAEDSDEEAQQCENRERKTKIGHIVTTLLGLSLLSITSLFKVGSDSFNAILALGLLTTGWCAVYWSHKLYKCLKKQDNEETVIETEHRDEFLQNCDSRLGIIKEYLRKYNIIVNSDTESDSGSSETLQADDVYE